MATRKFIMCSCHSESVLVEKHANEDEIYLSLFGRGLNVQRYNLKDRIRHIWQILTKGSPYTDEIVLSRESAKELADTLTTFANEN